MCPQKFSQRLQSAELAATASDPEAGGEPVFQLTTNKATEGTQLASGELVLLQTANTVVSSMYNANSKNVRMVLDAGSHRAYITKDLAKELHLKVLSSEYLYLHTFGSLPAKKVKFSVVEMQMTLLDGTIWKFNANTVAEYFHPYITLHTMCMLYFGQYRIT